MYRKGAIIALGASLLMAGMGSNAYAADNNAHVEGIIAGTYQVANESTVSGQNVENESNAQLYLFGTLRMGPGTWNVEVRGSTTPRANGVSSFYGANALVGETLNQDGKGRIAITQLFYELSAGPGQFRAGLLDPTAILDGSDVANDEYTQFLAGAFVNNPTIGFPSFVLGAAYQGKASSSLDYKVFMGSDRGLEEAGHSYGNVFDIDGKRGGHDKGAFASAELDWHSGGYALKGGIWYDTGDIDNLNATGTTNGYGVYALAGAPLASGRILARIGVANDDAQAAANFLSVAYQQPVRLSGHATTLGLAIARTDNADHIPGIMHADAIYQAEAYWRINVTGSLYVSPDLQYIKNPGFDADRDSALISGLRIGYTF